MKKIKKAALSVGALKAAGENEKAGNSFIFPLILSEEEVIFK